MALLPWKKFLRGAMREAPERGVRLKVLRRRCVVAAEQFATEHGFTIDRDSCKRDFLEVLQNAKKFVSDGTRVWKRDSETQVCSVGEEQPVIEDDAGASNRSRTKETKVPTAVNGAITNVEALKQVGEEEEKEEEDEGPANHGRGYTERWNNAPMPQRFGKFSEEEKKAVLQAIQQYAEAHDLDRENLEWLISTKKVRKGAEEGSGKGSGKPAAWLEIAAACPHRSPKQVWAYGTRHYHPDNFKGKWTPEEDRQLGMLVSDWGTKWVDIGKEIGRMPLACADRYKLIRGNFNTGKWTEAETEALNELVEEWRQGGGTSARRGSIGTMLTSREALPWASISQKLGTRSQVQCAEKYYKMAPTMTASGQWEPKEDLVLLTALYYAEETEETSVKWGQLVPGRDKATCIRRWKLMLKRVKNPRDLGFVGCVEDLVNKYAPHLLSKEGSGGPAGGTEKVEGDGDKGGELKGGERSDGVDGNEEAQAGGKRKKKRKKTSSDAVEHDANRSEDATAVHDVGEGDEVQEVGGEKNRSDKKVKRERP